MKALSRRIILAGSAAVLSGLTVGAAVKFLPQTKNPAQPSIADIGGDFSLSGGDGKTVSSQDFRGQYMLIYFGYTHCPDVCPTTLSNMAAALDALGPVERKKITPVFITVDPERDTPKIAGDYAHAFGPEFIGLSGSLGDIGKVADEYRVFFEKRYLKSGDYSMDHSSILYVMGPQGTLAGILPADLDPKDLAQRLQALGV